MTVVQFQPELGEGALADGVPIPRGTAMRSLISKGDPTACEYRTAHDVRLYPFQVAEAQYYMRDLASLELPGGIPPTKAAIRIRLTSPSPIPVDKIKAERLAFFIRGGGETQMRLYEQIFAHGVGIVVQPKARPVKWRQVVSGSEIRQLGFEAGQAMLPYGARSFQGYRMLHEYFAFPPAILLLRAGRAGAGGCGDAPTTPSTSSSS